MPSPISNASDHSLSPRDALPRFSGSNTLAPVHPALSNRIDLELIRTKCDLALQSKDKTLADIEYHLHYTNQMLCELIRLGYFNPMLDVVYSPSSPIFRSIALCTALINEKFMGAALKRYTREYPAAQAREKENAHA